jgi:hypothetical protein
MTRFAAANQKSPTRQIAGLVEITGKLSHKSV